MTDTPPSTTGAEAETFAQRWVDAWNAHDLDQIMEHYSPDVTFTSPIVAKLGPAFDGTLYAAGQLRSYFRAVLRRHPDRRLALIVYAVGACTGGVLASWASLAHVFFAAPSTVLAFAGARVSAAVGVTRDEIRAEAALANGQIDGIVSPSEFRDAAVVLACAAAAAPSPARTVPSPAALPQRPPRGWQAVLAARSNQRRTSVGAILTALLGSHVRLNGDRAGTDVGRDDCDVIALVGEFAGVHAAVIALGGPAARATPAGLRLARRAVSVAVDLGLPIITLVDTPGALPTFEAEIDGLAGEVARCLQSLVAADVASIGILCGEGTGGTALALLGTDVIAATATSWLGPLDPEAAANLLRTTPPAAIDRQRVGGVELFESGVVQHLVEDGDIGALEAIIQATTRSSHPAPRRPTTTVRATPPSHLTERDLSSSAGDARPLPAGRGETPVGGGALIDDGTVVADG